MKINAITNTVKYSKIAKNTIQKPLKQALKNDVFQKNISFRGYEEECEKNLAFLKNNETVKRLIKNKSITTKDLLPVSRLKSELLEEFTQKIADEEIFDFLSFGSLSLFDIEETVNFDNEQMQQYKSLLRQNVNPHQASFCVSYGLCDCIQQVLDSDNITSKMYKKGATDPVILYADEHIEKQNLNNFLDEVGDGYRIAYTREDNGNSSLVASKIMNLKSGTKIQKTITLLPTGEITKSTTQKDPDGNVYSWNYSADRTVQMQTSGISTFDYAYDPNVEQQIEIIKDKTTDEPRKIIYTHKSDLLNGVYEIEEFDLNDYPEDFDVVKMIKNGEISGKKIATVKKDQNSTTFVEDFNYKDTNTKREYVQKTDKNGKTISKLYKYKITNNNGENLLNINRSWEKISDTKTKTTINSKEYFGDFDDENKTIKIKDPNGKITEISISDMLTEAPDEDFILEESNEEFFEMLKSMPLDKILEMEKTITKIAIVDDIESSFVPPDELNLGINSASFYHEVMHSLDYDFDTDEFGKISENEELIDIYSKELKEFSKEYPAAFREVIGYFLPSSLGMYLENNDSENFMDEYYEDYESYDEEEDINDIEEEKSMALKEFVAETNVLLADYGERGTDSYTRSQYLAWYFPKTVAKVNEILNS